MQRHRNYAQHRDPPLSDNTTHFLLALSRKRAMSLDQHCINPDEIGGMVLRIKPVNMSYCLFGLLHSTCHQKSLIYKKKKTHTLIYYKELEFRIYIFKCQIDIIKQSI